MSKITHMEDCKTQEDYAKYFQEYNDLPQKTYCNLALKKLQNLNDLQCVQLVNLIKGDEVNGKVGWDAYCHILTIEQINDVGW